MITSNKPLPYTKHDNRNLQDLLNVYLFSFVILLGMSFFMATFIMLPVKEKETDAKHLQFVSGVNSAIYWFGHFLIDFGFYILVCSIMLIPPALITTKYFNSGWAFWNLIVVLIMFGWACLPFTYVISCELMNGLVVILVCAPGKYTFR